VRVAHVLPFDPRHLGQEFDRWVDAQLVRWPFAAIARSRLATSSSVHMLGPRARIRAAPPLSFVEHRSLASGPRFRDWGDDWSASLGRAIRRLGPDDICVVHLNDYSAARLAERAAVHTRVVLVFHGRGLRGWETADALAVLHEDAGRELRDAGAGAGRVHVLAPSVDTSVFHPPETPGDSSILGFVGRLEEAKGIAELPRILQRVPEARIEAAGNGELKLSAVTLLGELPAAEVAERMRTWRLLLLPSHTEGYPRVALEAAASGLPVVAVAGVLPRELERRPGVHVASRATYPDLVARLLAEPRQRHPSDWVQSHDDAALAWDDLLESLPRWRVRPLPRISRMGRIRRFRPPRRLVRWLLRP
jgi:glycosyltransferase involved in cell wall biosynthesis